MKHRLKKSKMQARGSLICLGKPKEVLALKKQLLILLLAGTVAANAVGCAAGAPKTALSETSSKAEALSPEDEAPPEDSSTKKQSPCKEALQETGVPLSEVDWAAFQSAMSQEEYEALQSYLPVLTGQKEFLWVRQPDGTTEESPSPPGTVTIDAFRQTICKEEELLILGVGTPDLEGDGTRELVLYLENRAGHFLILHQEEDAFYATDRTIRAFNILQTNGVYHTSSSSVDGDWRRMDCRGGAFTEEILGHIQPNKDPESRAENYLCYYIGEEMVDRDTFDQWVEENSPGSAYFPPSRR